MIVPSLDLVVVITAETDGLNLENRELINRFILPAVRG